MAKSYLIGCTASLLSLGSAATAQDEPADHSPSIGLELGYSLPVGDWKRHPYAGVDQFGPGIVVKGEIEFMAGENFGIAIGGGYLQLNTNEWEEYALSRSSEVKASASIALVGLVFKPYIVNAESDQFKLELGLNLAFPSGHEEFDRWSYDYDFMKSPRIGIMFGVEYARLVSQRIALTLKAGGLLIPEGLDYVDRGSSSISALPATIGFRFYI